MVCRNDALMALKPRIRETVRFCNAHVKCRAAALGFENELASVPA